MLRNRFVSAVGVVVLAGSLWSCGDSVAPDNNEIESVAIIGIQRTIVRGGSSQFEGRAITAGGVRVDGLITWTVSQPAVLGVTAELVPVGQTTVNRATVTGLAAGSSDLIATAGGRSASVRIVVSSGAP